MEQENVSQSSDPRDIVYNRKGEPWKVIERNITYTQPIEAQEFDPVSKEMVTVFRQHPFTVLKIVPA